MSIAGTIDAPLDIFGGLVTDMAAADLPQGVSPDCQDVAFLQGAVKTRPGLFSVFSPIAGNPTVNYLKTYTQPSLVKTLLAIDSAGTLWGENSPGVLSQIATGLAQRAAASSTSLFGREYIAQHDGNFGLDMPRQYDGTNLDRVSQTGPGAGPTGIADIIANISTISRASNVVSVATASPHDLTVALSGATISAISRNTGVVTVTTATPHGLSAVGGVQIAGVTDASYNGSFPVASILDATHFTYAQAGTNSSSSGGTATYADQVVIAGTTGAVTSFNGTFVVASTPDSTHFTFSQTGGNESGTNNTGTANPLGQISAGVHQCAVIFVTRQGYLTRPSPPVSWTAAGGRRANVAGIPSAATLANVVARILAFTGAGGDSFFYTTGLSGAPQMQVFDNSASSFVVDFSDTALLAGISADPLFNLVELGECAGVIGYSDRLFWWGERNKQNNWDNLTFDGGFGGASGFVPLGWTPDPTFFADGSYDTTGHAIWGGAYSILGDGVTATRGLITQSAAADHVGAPRLQANTGYSARARLRMTGALAQGTLHVHLYSASANISTTGISVPAAQVTSSAWTEFIAPIAPSAGFTSIPSDLVLRVYADGTPTSGAGFLVDNIEVFPTTQPYNTSLVRASRAEDPESYDGVSGFLNVSENDGQSVRAAFLLRERLYFVKDRAVYVTEDDGVNEPASWTINEVSRAVGTPSVSGVDTGEDWAVLAGRAGLYIFDGGEPVKISQEIQPLWDQINWAAAQTLWVRIDTRNKRILCGVPIGTATSPNRILMMDYRGLLDASEIASLGSVHFSSFTGKLFAVGRSRKWCPWNITANCCALAERSDGTAQVFLGNGLLGGAGNGKIYQLLDTQFSDDGAAINSYYTTYFFLSYDLEQALQVRSHRKLFAYLTVYAEGAGNLNLSSFVDNEAYPTALTPLPLSSPSPKDLELPINLLGERVAFQFSTNATGAWFKLERFTPSLLPDPWAPVRGGN